MRQKITSIDKNNNGLALGNSPKQTSCDVRDRVVIPDGPDCIPNSFDNQCNTPPLFPSFESVHTASADASSQDVLTKEGEYISRRMFQVHSDSRSHDQKIPLDTFIGRGRRTSKRQRELREHRLESSGGSSENTFVDDVHERSVRRRLSEVDEPSLVAGETSQRVAGQCCATEILEHQFGVDVTSVGQPTGAPPSGRMFQERDEFVPKLNVEQKQIYDLIMDGFANNRQELIFVYGHGGTGKTFLWKTIISSLRAEGRIVLAVASSGIASLLLPSGRTAHSRFKIPLELTDESLCKVKKNTHIGALLAETDLIIWDEAPMNGRRCFEALDRTLRDILDSPDILFGGKTIVLGGDFRQTLPVIKGAPKMEIVASSIASSHLWSQFRLMTLKENMRVFKCGMTLEEQSLAHSFASWLLDVGDGKIGEADDGSTIDTAWIEVPQRYCIEDDGEGLNKLIDFIYDKTTLQTPSAVTLQQKAIVCPKNETADAINLHVLKMVPGESTTYASYDIAIPLTGSGAENEMLYPPDYLNTFKLPGFPPHELELKVGTPVMLLRNVSLGGGLCNGTRMIVTQLMSRLIQVQVITGTRVGEKVFIHRISLVHKDDNLPFLFKRTQFPIKLCYAMTINKSQGQSLNKIGVYLPEPIFGHGQLYVALSRATSPHGLKVLMKQQENRKPNETKNIVYRDFLGKINRTLYE